jgi:hypothetical protein
MITWALIASAVIALALVVRVLGKWTSLDSWFAAVFASAIDPPPLKWSDLRYVFDIKEDCNGKEAIQA